MHVASARVESAGRPSSAVVLSRAAARAPRHPAALLETVAGARGGGPRRPGGACLELAAMRDFLRVAQLPTANYRHESFQCPLVIYGMN